MNWSFAEKSDLPAIRALLCRREWECVSLTGRLLSDGTYRLPASGRARIAVRRENGRVAQVLYMAKSGIVIPYFPGLPLEDFREAEAVREIFQQAGVRISVLPGLKANIEALTDWVGIHPLVSVDYYLMVRGDLSQETPLPSRVEFPYLEIRRAKPEDFNTILPLQEAYEKEEILFREKDFDSAKMRDELKLNLKTQLIYLGFYAGELIVKGGTNARGFTSDQIGGVYTRPDFRNKRVARFLMERLLRHIFADGKTACLFVKKHNLPAIRLYTGLGFRIAENYRISYF